MIARREAVRLVGESMREMGILVLVFAPLDALFEPHRPGQLFLVLVIVGGLFGAGLGITIEAWMRE